MDSTPSSEPSGIPIVDLAPWSRGSPVDRAAVASAVGRACREHGFFYLVGHRVDPGLIGDLAELSRSFFALPEPVKMRIAMARGGRAWRGYFPVGAELTSGRPDLKEGLYFGAELAADHPAVRDRVPMHGPNLFPEPGEFPEFPAADRFRGAVLDYMAAMTGVGHRVMEVIAVSLGLPPEYFAERYTRDPLVLFRIFHYPPLTAGAPGDWSVAEHTDYGVLTMLLQDDSGGLQVKTRAGWIDAPPVDGALVCNLGDMLDRMTGGLYRSTPHRVRNRSRRSRLSFPFFFDPAFDAEVRPIDPQRDVVDDAAERWDRASVHGFSGTYGEYLLAKVGKVFPGLGTVAPPDPHG